MTTSSGSRLWWIRARRCLFSDVLDFARAVDLFMASEQELALALGIPVGDLRAYRNNPNRVPPSVMAKMGRVLVERSKGMQRVGEMLIEEADQTPKG